MVRSSTNLGVTATELHFPKFGPIDATASPDPPTWGAVSSDSGWLALAVRALRSEFRVQDWKKRREAKMAQNFENSASSPSVEDDALHASYYNTRLL